jgi:hypothetical protein
VRILKGLAKNGGAIDGAGAEGGVEISRPMITWIC